MKGEEVGIHFTRFDARRSTDALIQWLSSEDWPFHVYPHLTEVDILQRLRAGVYDPPANETYWITAGDVDALGMLHISDLTDTDYGSPSFDLRIRAHARGRGMGTTAVRWLNNELFGRYRRLHRIGASTRVDNYAMRATFARCGYVKEAQFRQAWPTQSGERLDSLEYGILRHDWAGGVITPVNWTDPP
jgi:RimJ/RimL family protein N-acetyltransferase